MEKQLAWEYIKSRKKKNIISIITIALVTAFLTAVCLYGYSFNKMTVNSIISVAGKHHGIIIANSSEDLNKMEKHELVKNSGRAITVKSESNESYNLTYEYNDKKALGYYDLEVTSGIYPKTDNEVAIDKLYADRFNKQKGDTISFLDKEFKIVGIIDNLTYTREDNKNYRVFVSESFASSVQSKAIALLELNNVMNYEQDLKDIAKVASISEDNVEVNIDGIEIDRMVDIAPYVLIGSLIVLSAFFIIYNIFNLVLNERMKTIGLLLTIGVTGKQVRKIVLYEAIFLALIAIPVGAIVGFLVTKVLMGSLDVNGDLRLYIQPLMIGLALLGTLLTVIISVILPAIRVSKLSPIEASRYVGGTEISNKGKKRKEGKNLFTDLAKVNAWRNKKAAVVTTISIVLFIVAATILRSMSLENMISSQFISNVQVDLRFEDVVQNNYIDNEVIDKIKNVKGAENVVGLKTKLVNEEDEMTPALMGINDKIIKRAEEKLVEGNIDIDEFKQGKTGIVYQVHNRSEHNVGDYIDVKDENGQVQRIKIVAVLEESIVSTTASRNTIYVHNDSDIFGKNPEYIKLLMDTEKKDSKEISEKIKPIVDGYKNLMEPKNYEDGYKDLKKEKKDIELLGYIIVSIIGVIGIMNFINSTISGIMARRKELGMLRAVGLTDKEIKQMLIKEGYYLAGTSLTIGVVLGNILAVILVYLFRNLMGATYAVYTFPALETAICIMAILITLVITSTVVVNKITKVSVVEQIKFED